MTVPARRAALALALDQFTAFMGQRLRLRWALDRARAMSAAELAWRAQGALRARGERLLDRLGLADGQPPLARVADPALEGEELLFGSRPPAFLAAEHEERASLARALAAADRASAGGSARVSADESARASAAALPASEALAFPSDWNRDPVTGRVFPLVHWSKINYRLPAGEEAIRRLWYLSRHRLLPEAALTYYLAGERQAADAVAARLESWIAQCPPYRGIHWLVPLELALRLIAWSITARLLRGSDALGALAPRLARSVHLQAEHVRSHLSRHSSANNHLIGQAAGLVHAGIAFAGLRQAGRWRETGARILWREILRQTTDDGVSREASTHYHELVLELGLLVWLLLRANGEEPPPAARARLEAMLDFLAELTTFPGGPPELGDSDGETALPFHDEAPARSTLLALGAVLCRRGDWKRKAGGLTRRAVLLLGEEGRAEFESLAAEAEAPLSRAYATAGYALLRDTTGDRAVLFDCGELGYLSTAAHAHADCLSIVLGAFGEHLLVDPGTYTYHAEPVLRDFFRSTAAHNTLRVDGEEQSEMRGPFLWGRRARGRLVEWASRPAIDLVAGEHDGYRRLDPPVTHRRTVVFVKPDYFWVVDELDGEGEHLLEQFLHLGETTVSRGPGGAEVLARTARGPALRILALAEAQPEIDLLRGCERPLQGWVSPRFGERRPAVVWRRIAVRAAPTALHLLLRPLAAAGGITGGADQGHAMTHAGAPGGASGDPETVAAHSLASGYVLHARGMPGEDLVVLARGGQNAVRGSVAGAGTLAGEVELEGRWALVRCDEEGITAVAGEGLRRLSAGGRPVIEVEGEPASFSLRRLGDRAVVEGSGGRVWVRDAAIRDLRSDGAALDVERSRDRLGFRLAAAGAPDSAPDPTVRRAEPRSPSGAML